MKYLTLLILLALVSCKKDAQTVLNGTYLVMTDDHKGHHTTGTIVINGNNITLSGLAWGNHSGTITPAGDNFTVNKSGSFRSGNGSVNDNEIKGHVQIFYSGGIDDIDFEGSK